MDIPIYLPDLQRQSERSPNLPGMFNRDSENAGADHAGVIKKLR